MYPTPPSLVKFALQLASLVMGAGSFAPSRLHVPEERNSPSPCSIGMPSTALAVSWVAHSTTAVCPPTSAATASVRGPSTAPGAVRLGNSRCGSPSAARMAVSYCLVSAFTRPVEVALVYSRALTPHSFHKRYSGSIKKSSAWSSRPASLSAYSWYTVLKGWNWMPVRR